MNNLAPVVVFGYNRPTHLKDCLNALTSCDEAKETDLYIFCDGPKAGAAKEKCALVAEVAKKEETLQRFSSVTVNLSQENKGLARSIIEGVTAVIKKYGRCIVLEDDLVVSPYFLKFMNAGLERLRQDERIWSVTGYTFPLKSLEGYCNDGYLSYRISSTGWGTWADRWEKVDWEVKDYPQFAASLKQICAFNKGGSDMFRTLRKCVVKGMDVWAIRFSYAQFKNGMYTVYPRRTLLKINGFDGSGTNSQTTDQYQVLEFDEKFTQFSFENLECNEKIAKAFKRLYRFSFAEWLKYRIKCFKRKN